jgi:hypothetical protein
MEELSVISELAKEDLFLLFAAQLKKDFENSGLDAAFVQGIPREFGALKDTIAAQVEVLLLGNSSYLKALLYRIDISEQQIKKYTSANPSSDLAAVVAELIIKRTLQKVILKKNFSGRNGN